MNLARTLLVVTLVVGSVYGQKRCCTPPQYMAGNAATVGQVDPTTGPEGFYSVQQGAFDFTNRRFGYNMSIYYPNGTTTNYRLIQKYGEGYQWVILDAFKYCAKQPATKPEPINCIPANATWVGTTYMGGEKGLYIDGWKQQYRHPQDPIEGAVTINVVQGNCYPFSSSFLGNRYNGATAIPMIATAAVFNMTLGIPEPDKWFTPPSFCDQEENHISSRRPRSVIDLEALNIPNFMTFF